MTLRYLSFLAATLAFPGIVAAQNWTLELSLDGRRIQGAPVDSSPEHVLLLGRDGYLWEFHPNEAETYRKVSNDFRPMTQSEMRGVLLREFGRDYEVSGTGNYLVVHPRGRRDLWAPRFESLYRSFMHYFTARGTRPTPPQFPLVAVVFPTRQHFDSYATRQGDSVSPGLLGYYSVQTNRVLLYDVTGGDESESWYINAETIIHEATHQTAFNTGIHSRFGSTPRWVAEGLGTMFEARGVWNSRLYRSPQDRINQERLTDFRRFASRRPRGFLPTFVSSDRPFQTSPQDAYAEAWALTFFLAEREPAKLTQYLRVTAARPAFQIYSSAERLRDFRHVFGDDLAMLEARFLRFIGSLP